ncbi:MAG: hypothetical protein ABIK65_10875 [Candidatus Eisenbacteria bacterium]
MKHTALIILVLAGALVLPAPSRCVRTAEWDVTGREAVLKGTPAELTVGPLGALELSPRFEPVADVDEFYAWSLVSDGKGNLYVGTGNDGKIYRVDSKGKATLLFDSLEFDILALAFDREGNLYAGTSPGGIVFKIDKDGKGRSLFDSPDHYVWSLVFDDAGNLYAGTGEQGKIYKIPPSGEAELFYDSPETNVLDLLYDGPRKRLLAGGDGRGLVTALDRDGKPSVLFEGPRAEVSALWVDEGGRIYAAASGDREPSKNGEESPKKKALLYRIEPDGTAFLLWRSEAEFIYALAPEPGGTILVGTGTPGALVRLSPDGEPTELKRTSESQVLGLARAKDEVWVSTGNQGRIYRVGPERGDEGTYDSEVKDALNLSRWGRLRWWGEEPNGTKAVFSTRSGNTEEPDEAWSDWAPVGSGERGGAVQSPPARFLQWRVGLEGKGDAGPRVDRVTVAYKEGNLPPAVLEVGVTRVGDTFLEGPADPRPEPLFQVLPNGTRVEFMPINRRDPIPGAADEVWARSVRVIRWQASDPNGDPLRHEVHYRAEGEKEWKLLDDEVLYDYYAWETGSMPDGLYRVRVTAHDDPENSEATALSGRRVSDAFTIDNTAPEVRGLEATRSGEKIRIRGEARDGASPIRNAAVSVDSGEWRPVDTADEIFDDVVERFDFEVDAGEGSEHVILVRVTDQAGNTAVGRAAVR